MSKEIVQERTEMEITSLPVLTPAHLKKQLSVETERRHLLQKFIQENLTEGVDYGRIHLATKDRCAKPRECKNEYHLSKPCLFKPGAEKFCSLLQLRAEFAADKETLEMMGGNSGVIAFRCQLTHIPSGRVMAEGRGTCSLSEKGGLANTAVKIAEKRAHIDAVLRLGLSDSFTQDIEDMKEVADAVDILTPVVVPQKVTLSPQQFRDIRTYAFVKRADMNSIREYVLKAFDSPLEEITPEQAGKVMAMLRKKYGKLENIEQFVTEKKEKQTV
jgi:hypothetical protein